MKHYRFLIAAIAVAVIAAVPAGAQVIPAQDNPWTTGNNAQINFTNFGNVDLRTVLNGTPNSTTLTFSGVALNSQLGSADTLVRSEQVDVTSGTNSANLTLEALSLSSSVGTTDGRNYKVALTLAYAGTGSASFARANSDGGTYDSSFTVTPIITFTNTANSSDVRTVDCSLQTNNCSFVMSGSGNWTLSQSGGFDPSTLGIQAVPSGVQVGSYTTVGRPQFGAIYPGIQGTASTGYSIAPQNEFENAGNSWHKPAPPVVKCKAISPAGAATPSGAAGTQKGAATTIATQFCTAL